MSAKLCRHGLAPDECADCIRNRVPDNAMSEQEMIDRHFVPAWREYIDVNQGQAPDPDDTARPAKFIA